MQFRMLKKKSRTPLAKVVVRQPVKVRANIWLRPTIVNVAALRNGEHMSRSEKEIAPQAEVSISEVSSRIYTLRGAQIMLDSDLAEIYKVETKTLKRAVRRNIERFPADFMF